MQPKPELSEIDSELAKLEIDINNGRLTHIQAANRIRKIRKNIEV
jgi:hypothetical protein